LVNPCEPEAMSAFLPESDSEDELPPGWEERATLAGEVYYANHQLASTQWEHPRTGERKKLREELPFGWDRQILPDNKVVYVDLVNKKTTFTDPRLAFAKEKSGPDSKYRQKFDASSTARQVLHGRDLSGKMALVTGATGGLGYEVCRVLVLQGCSLILAARDRQAGEQAAARLREERGGGRADVKVVTMDLVSLSSVRAAVLQVAALTKSLDWLLLCAGTRPSRHTLSQDGLEAGIQVNFLGQAYLTLLLVKRLCLSLTSKVVFLSAEAHRFSSLSEDSPEYLKTSFSTSNFNPGASHFNPQLQYNDSKLISLLFSQALHRRYSHLGLTSVAVHPGHLLHTSLYKDNLLLRLLSMVLRPWAKSVAQAAASVVISLVEDTPPKHFTGYINNCFPTLPAPEACDMHLQNTVWDLTIQILEDTLGKGMLEEFEIQS